VLRLHDVDDKVRLFLLHDDEQHPRLHVLLLLISKFSLEVGHFWLIQFSLSGLSQLFHCFSAQPAVNRRE
jgi:hypothetical protein